MNYEDIRFLADNFKQELYRQYGVDPYDNKRYFKTLTVHF